jgi:hypothetical protein
MKDYFCVRGGREYRASFFQFASLFAGERKITVVTYGYLAVLAGNQERLGFSNRNLPGCGVTNMPDCAGTWQTVKAGLIECFGNMPHRAFLSQFGSV